jgi:tetratricopeptide (TPR) repeat protein
VLTAVAPRARRSACAALALAIAAGAGAADLSRERGVRLAHEGRCEPALPDLDATGTADPRDAEVALLAGECRVRLHRYPEAVRDLERAAQLRPDRPRVWIALAKARYHAGDPAGAQAALDRVPDREDDAEASLYAGMLALDRGDAPEAVRLLERARDLDADAVEPVASYYLGLAHAGARDAERAVPALERVSSVWRGTDWSVRADQELARLRAGGARQVWIAAGAGFEHDSNVVLRGRGVTLPSDISDDADERGVWNASAGAELWRRGEASAGLMGSYRGTTHVDLHEFDAHFPTATGWLSVPLDRATRGTARYDFGYAWLDGDPYAATSNWQVSFARDFADWGEITVYGRVFLDDYFFESDDVPDAVSGVCPPGVTSCGPPGLDERSARRRSGTGAAGGIAHTLPLALPPSERPLLRGAALRAGYELSGFDARGREYSYQAHEWLAGFALSLPLALELDVASSFAYVPFRRASTYPEPDAASGPYVLSGRDRLDEVYRVETSLTRSLGERISVTMRWRFVDNQSNTGVFDYQQHVVGVYVDAGIGREL